MPDTTEYGKIDYGVLPGLAELKLSDHRFQIERAQRLFPERGARRRLFGKASTITNGCTGRRDTGLSAACPARPNCRASERHGVAE